MPLMKLSSPFQFLLHKAPSPHLPVRAPLAQQSLFSSLTSPINQPNMPNQPSQQSNQSGTNSKSQEMQSPLGLPEPDSDKTTELNVNGEGVRLHHLGPLVVNKDGTLSRIANWDQMAEIERQNTLRVLGKRNQLRMEGLKSQEEQSE